MSRQRRLSPKEKRKIKQKNGQRMDSKFSMNHISPLTPTQEEFFDSYNAGYNIAAIGTAL